MPPRRVGLDAAMQGRGEDDGQGTRYIEVDRLDPAGRVRGQRADGQPHVAVVRLQESLTITSVVNQTGPMMPASASKAVRGASRGQSQ
jgi:hypothetical protein